MEHKKIVEEIRKKKLYFTITTGRSGTSYLTRYLNKHPKITAKHEPYPNFHECMREIQQNPEKAVQFWLQKKLPEINKINKYIYIETSHLICKGFLEPLIDLGIIPNLILLSRNKRDVAMSMLKLNTIPGRTNLGLIYYLQPSDNVKLPLKEWQKLSDYQLCFWYTLEIEARQIYYTNKFKKIGSQIIFLDFKELTTSNQRRLNLISEIGLTPYNPFFFIKSRIQKKVNQKLEMKSSISTSINFEEEEQKLYELLNQQINESNAFI